MWQYAIDFAASLSDTEIKIISAYHANTQAIIKQIICLFPHFPDFLDKWIFDCHFVHNYDCTK